MSEESFETALDRLVMEWGTRPSSEELICAVELMLYRLKEEAAGDDFDV